MIPVESTPSEDQYRCNLNLHEAAAAAAAAAGRSLSAQLDEYE